MNRISKNLILVIASAVVSTALGVSFAYASPTPPTWVKIPTTSVLISDSHILPVNFCVKAPGDSPKIYVDWVVKNKAGSVVDFGSVADPLVAEGFSDFPAGCSSGGSSGFNFNLNQFTSGSGEATDGIYTIYLTPKNSGGDAAPKKSVSSIYDTIRPTAPTLNASASNGKVALSWTESSDTNFSKYKLYRDGALLTTTTSRSFSDDLANNKSFSHTYIVKAMDKAGNSSTDSDSASFTYVPPTTTETTDTEAPVVPAPLSFQPGSTTLPTGPDATENEVKGAKQIRLSNPLVKVAAVTAIGLGALGVALFFLLRRKEKNRSVVQFETIAVDNTNRVVKDSSDENPISKS